MGIRTARNVHLACFLSRLFGGVAGETPGREMSLASPTAGQEGRLFERGLLHDQLAPQHPHLTLEAMLAGLVWGELHGDFFAFGQFGALVEIGKEYHLRAGRTLPAGEAQPHRLPGLHANQIRRIAAFHRDPTSCAPHVPICSATS